MKKINWVLVLSLLFIDRIIKQGVIGIKQEVIPNIFSLNYVQNSGIAFGYLNRYNSIVIIVSMLIILFFVVYILSLKVYSKKICIYSNIILAGSIGNLIDRLFNGYVIDYISILDFPIFNLSDICIVCGMLLLIIELNRVGVCDI